MTPCKWEEDLRLSIPQIDQEHLDLLEAASAFRSAAEQRASVSELKALLATFIACAENHFANEEAMMLSSGYAGHQSHRNEHQRLLGQVYLVKIEFAEGKVSPGNLFSLFMETWTRQHIAALDKPFAEFLRQAGAPQPPSGPVV